MGISLERLNAIVLGTPTPFGRLIAADVLEDGGLVDLAMEFRDGGETCIAELPYGSGDGAGYGSGDGDGSGDGAGYGSGDGDGSGYGDGYGSGDGDGYGSGYGYGYGYGA